MADNPQLSAGTADGAIVAGDDVTVAGHTGPAIVQYVKLVDGTADGTQPIQVAGGTEANALRVTIANDSTGVVSVDDNGGALTVDNAGTFATQEDGAALTALQLIDDIVSVDDTTTHTPATTKGANIMAVATPTDGSVDANDIGMVAMSLNRRLHVDADIGASVTLTVDGSGVTQPVSGTVTANAGSGTMSVDLGVNNDVVINSGTITDITNNVNVNLQDGAGVDLTSTLVGADQSLDVNVTQSIALDVSAATVTVDGSGVTQPVSGTVTANAGTGTMSVDLGANNDVTIDPGAVTSLALIDDTVFADDAAFTLASSKVNMAGAIRDDSLGALTAVEGDAVPLRVNSTGALHVTGGGGGTEYTLGTNTYTEATTIGSVAAVVRSDAGGSLVNTDNEITALQVDSAGALRVTGGGGGTEYNEDVATPATIVGTATLIERDDALSPVTPVEGDWIGLRGSAEGALWTQDFNSDAVLADTNTIAGDTTSINGKITACNTGAVVLAAGVAEIGNVKNSGTFAVQIDAGAVASLALIDDVVSTDDTTTHTPATTKGVNIMAVAAPTDGSVEANDIGMVAMSTDRRLHVDGSGVTQPVSGTVTANLSATDNSVLDNIQTSVDTIAAAVSTEMQVDVVGSLPAGTNAIGKLAANSGVDIGDVDVTSIAAGTNLVGDVGISGARTSGGTTLYKNIDVDETEDQVKGTAGQIYWLHAINLKATPLYLKIYNATAASVIVGTTVPDLTFPIPSQGDTNGAGFTLAIPNGIAFSTAITIACTTGVADADSGAPGANECIVNLGYA